MAVAALSITPERERLVDFSEAYAEDGYKVIVSKNSKLGDDFQPWQARQLLLRKAAMLKSF